MERREDIEDLLDWRFNQSYLQFLDSFDTLPTVPVIRGFETWSDKLDLHHRNIAPATVSVIVSRLPRLREFQGWLSDNERKDHSLRNKLRADFAPTISLWPASIKNLELEYVGWPPFNPSFQPLKRSEPGNDALSIALHSLSQQLTMLTLKNIMIAPELFWPPGLSAKSAPAWPKLTSFRLEYTIATPSGRWLFERDPRWVGATWDYEIDHKLDPENHRPE
ncbi:hypothetical protein BJX63DRAFT_376066 [Aspergillus granulosus]|uniref:Uncharacterized protein n=1 Tax=Aspergillus granulosus TaxID=176169 RepID=A0ABR4I5H9_9EURO